MICLTSLVYVLHKYDAGDVFLRLRHVQIGWLVLAWVLVYAVALLNTLKWRSILHSFGRKDSLLRLWIHSIEGRFFNLFFPGFVAGDISRIARTSQGGESSFDALMAVFLDRFIGLLVTCLFVGSVALLGGYNALDDVWQMAVFLVILFAVAAPIVLLNTQLVQRIIQFLPGFLAKRAKKTAEMIQFPIKTITSRPKLLCRLILLSLFFVLGLGPIAYFVAQAVNFHIPLHLLMIYVPLITVLSNLPISIAGVGVRENLSVFFFSTLDFPPEDIIAFALSQSALALTVNLSGGAILLLRSMQPHSKSWR